MSNINQVTEQELQAKAVAPRISKEQIDELMGRIQFVTVQQPNDTTATFVHAFLDGNFFLATGFSACVSKENFNADIGVRLATENCKKQAENKLWELEGYILYVYQQEYNHSIRQKVENVYEDQNPTGWIDRLQEELAHIDVQRAELSKDFVNGGDDIYQPQRILMEKQKIAQDVYASVLSERIAIAKANRV